MINNNTQRQPAQTRPATTTEKPAAAKQLYHEYVFVKELKTATTKQTNKSYPIIVSHTGELWRLFNNEKVEIGKAYTISYEKSDDGQFKNVRQIIPLANIFKQQALKELSSINDIKRDVFMSLAYAKDIAVSLNQNSPEIPLEKIFNWSNQIYSYVIQKANTEYDSINGNAKEVK
jgi:hypothetical protein